MKKKRIAFVLGSMKRGGAERVISILSNHYASKGWVVDIILLLSGECDYELDQKIRIISLAGTGSRLRQLPDWIFGIRKYLKEYRPDTILSFAARINIITAVAAFGIRTNLVVSERNDPEMDGRSFIVRLATNLIYPRTSRVVFQTKKAQACFNDRVIENSSVIYNPINVSHKASNQSSNKIVAVGRLEPQKNHELLVTAFKSVHTLFPQYKLYIYGEGTLRNHLEELVRNLGLESSVFMPGNVDNVHDELSDAEFFVLSSDYEGLSNALLEAMMMGLPCISTDCAGSSEIIQSGKNGLLVPVGSKEKLAEAMKQLILDRDLALRLGKEAQNTSKLFASKNILTEWELVLEK